MSNDAKKHQMSKEEFKAFAGDLDRITRLRITQSHKDITEQQFIEALESKDSALCTKVRAWLKAGSEMRQHIEESRGDAR